MPYAVVEKSSDSFKFNLDYALEFVTSPPSARNSGTLDSDILMDQARLII